MNLSSKTAKRKTGGKKAGKADAKTNGEAPATPAPFGKPDLADIEKSSSALVVKAQDLVVDSDEKSVSAQEFYQAIGEEQKRLDARIDPIKKALNTAKSLILDEYKRVNNPMDEARRLIKRKIGDFEAEKAREARVVAEEQARKDREAQEAARNREAEALAKMGLDDLAEAKRKETIVETRPQAVTPGPARARGFAIQTRWDFEISDITKIPRKYLMPDMTKIRGVVVAMKQDHGIPGIRAFTKRV